MEPYPRRLGEKLDDVVLRHGAIWAICLRLHRPEFPVAVLDHQVDTCVAAPSVLPVVPGPDLANGVGSTGLSRGTTCRCARTACPNVIVLG